MPPGIIAAAPPPGNSIPPGTHRTGLWVAAGRRYPRPVPVDLRLLASFVAVAEERSFTRAARRLHLSQQSVSWHVQRLERELGVVLLERTTRRVEPTPAGEDLLVGARRVLAEVDELVARLRRHGSGELGEVRVGYSPAMGFELVPRITAELEASAPGLHVEWRELWMDELVSSLGAGTVDVALALEPPPLPGITEVALTTTSIAIQLARKHPLAGRASIGLSELEGLRVAVPGEDASPGLRDALLDACRKAGLEPEVVVLNRSHAAVPGMMFEAEAFGAWITIMPARYLPSELTLVPLRDSPVLRVCALYAEDRATAAVRRVLAAARRGSRALAPA